MIVIALMNANQMKHTTLPNNLKLRKSKMAFRAQKNATKQEPLRIRACP